MFKPQSTFTNTPPETEPKSEPFLLTCINHQRLYMAGADYRSPFRVLRDNEIYIMQICLSCSVIKFGWRILSKHGRLGGPLSIALLYYSANVIAVLCTGQLIMRTRGSMPQRERERERERECSFALVRVIRMESTSR